MQQDTAPGTAAGASIVLTVVVVPLSAGVREKSRRFAVACRYRISPPISLTRKINIGRQSDPSSLSPRTDGDPVAGRCRPGSTEKKLRWIKGCACWLSVNDVRFHCFRAVLFA